MANSRWQLLEKGKFLDVLVWFLKYKKWNYLHFRNLIAQHLTHVALVASKT